MDDTEIESDTPSASVSKTTKIDIPPQCRTVKAWFPDRPGREVIDEIKRHVAQTGLPHTWRGHTHARPPDNAVPVYLDEFDLPAKFLRAKKFAPCPCCSPEAPKYGKDGKIAWFPEEGIISLLGPDCFKSLNKEGHEQAKRQLEVERRRKRDTDYLMSKVPLLPAQIKVGEQAILIARALDDFRDALQAKLSLDRFELWSHVRVDGKLKVKELSKEFRPRADGTVDIADVEVDRVYASLSGYGILDPTLRSFVPPLQNALRKLRDDTDWREGIDAMEDDIKMAAANRIGSAIKAIKEARVKLLELRSFSDRITINTLRAWGQHEGCPMPRFFEHRADRIAFGKGEHQYFTVVIPNELSGPLDEMLL